MSHEGDATKIATLSPTSLVVKHLNRCMFPSLRYAPFPPHSADDIVKLSEGVTFSFVVHTFKSPAGRSLGPTVFRFANARIASSTSYLDGTSSSGLHGGHCVSLSTLPGSRVGDFVLRKFAKPPHPPLEDEGIIPQQLTFLVLDVLRVKRPLPFHIHPLEVFVEAEFITFSDTPFEVANVVFEEPLKSFRPRAFQLFDGRLQALL